MQIDIIDYKRLYKHYARLKFVGLNGKPVYIDLEQDELKQLLEQINQYFAFNEV